jgi:magnesium-transporting ATPase (P-type)
VLAICQRELPLHKDAAPAANQMQSDPSAAAAADQQQQQPATSLPDIPSPLVPESITSSPSLQLNCIVAIVDPPREEAITAIRSCHSAGIVVKMITGDHAATASTIGKRLGIPSDEVLVGTQLQAMTDSQLREHVER